MHLDIRYRAASLIPFIGTFSGSNINFSSGMSDGTQCTQETRKALSFCLGYLGPRFPNAAFQSGSKYELRLQVHELCANKLAYALAQFN